MDYHNVLCRGNTCWLGLKDVISPHLRVVDLSATENARRGSDKIQAYNIGRANISSIGRKVYANSKWSVTEAK